MYLDVGVEQRAKEWETLHVVHMEVAEQDVDPLNAGQVVAEAADPTASIEHNDPIVNGS
jgi:hypothetical protein